MSENLNFEFSVTVNGAPLKKYYGGGDTWVMGEMGVEYALTFKNNSYSKVVAVITVDGLSVMDGKSGSYNSSGYIIFPFDSVTVPGWRLNDKEVAKFTFSTVPSSYASQTGKPENIGVIGCAVFLEKKRMVRRTYRSLGGITGQSAGLYGDNPKGLGTGFGTAQAHEVRSENFDREETPVSVITIRYGDRETLSRAGISVDYVDSRPAFDRPQPFPQENRGCVPPAGWRG